MPVHLFLILERLLAYCTDVRRPWLGSGPVAGGLVEADLRRRRERTCDALGTW